MKQFVQARNILGLERNLHTSWLDRFRRIDMMLLIWQPFAIKVFGGELHNPRLKVRVCEIAMLL
jgi:menaquinone-dependent protoporphyrinogen IX oxidase